MPSDEATARRLLASGGSPLPIHNNCSGKHAAMLATCAVMGWPLDGYMELTHPCQQAVSAALQEMLGVDLDTARSRDRRMRADHVWRRRWRRSREASPRELKTPPSGARRTRWPPTPFSWRGLDASTRRCSRSPERISPPRSAAPAFGRRSCALEGRGSRSSSNAGGGEAMPVVAIAVLQQLGADCGRPPRAAREFRAREPAQLGWARCRGDPPGADRDALTMPGSGCIVRYGNS